MFYNQPENKNLVEDVDYLLSVKLPQIPLSNCREVENVSANQCGHICFPMGPKNTNLEEDLVYLLLVKFHPILIDCCKVENVSDNQRQGQPPLFFQSIARKAQNWYRTLYSCFLLLSFIKFNAAVKEEKS